MSPIFALIIAILALNAVSGTWTAPVKLMETHDHRLEVKSVYRDLSLTHLLVYNPNSCQHLAVAENGTIVSHKYFAITYGGVIRGAGDGKHLMMALDHHVTGGSAVVVNFTESSDGGKTWSPPVYAVKRGPLNKYLQDMLYIPSTGRVFIFFATDRKYELRMVTKPNNSVIFSGEMLVANSVYTAPHAAKVGYATLEGKGCLHLSYKNLSGHLVYTKSENNGISWSPPRKISEDKLSFISGILVSGPSVYIGFTTKGESPAVLEYSHDNGAHFAAVNITHDNAGREGDQGFAVCNDNKEGATLVSIFTEGDGKAEYAIWDTKGEMHPARRGHPYESVRGEITTAGTDCMMAAERRTVPAVVTVWENKHGYLYFATESA